MSLNREEFEERVHAKASRPAASVRAQLLATEPLSVNLS
jgi:hypothetical protein